MGKILCVTNGLAGLLYSSLELARRLADAGHEIEYASFPEIGPTVEHHGVQFHALPPSRYQEFLHGDAGKNGLNRLRHLSGRRQRAADAVAVTDLAGWIEDVGPDILLIDAEMHEHIIAASATGVPIALLNTFVSIWRRPGLPPPHHYAIPGRGWKGSRAGEWFLWQNLRLRKARRAVVQRMRHVGCDRQAILRQLAERVGCDLTVEADFNQWLIPFTFSRFPVLSLHALEFEFPHEPPPGVHYVGPMVLADRSDQGLDGEARGEIERLCLRRRDSGGRRKLIYAGFGSGFTTDLGLLNRLIAAVADHPDWELLISLGGQQLTADLGGLPANVHAFPWVPQTEVLKDTDVVVSHGGINTIDESVLARAPMLLYCGFETDMAGNTSRVEYHQLGIVGDRGRDTVATIRGHIDSLLMTARFKDSVDRMCASYLTYARNRVAERVVDSLLADSQPGRQATTR